MYHDTNGQNHGPVWKGPVVPLERNLYGHPLAGLLWERQFEKILLKHGWEKVSNWECLFVHREKGLFLSVHVDDIKLAGKKQNIDPMWKVLNKEVDLGEPTSFLDHVPWDVLKDNVKEAKILLTITEPCLICEFPRGALKNYHARKICEPFRGPTIWRVMPGNVWNDIVSWQTGRLNNSTKYQLHALTTIISKRKNWNLWENCQKYALKLF